MRLERGWTGVGSRAGRMTGPFNSSFFFYRASTERGRRQSKRMRRRSSSSVCYRWCYRSGAIGRLGRRWKCRSGDGGESMGWSAEEARSTDPETLAFRGRSAQCVRPVRHTSTPEQLQHNGDFYPPTPPTTTSRGHSLVEIRKDASDSSGFSVVPCASVSWQVVRPFTFLKRAFASLKATAYVCARPFILELDRAAENVTGVAWCPAA